MKSTLKNILFLGIFCTTILNSYSQTNFVSKNEIKATNNSYIVVETDVLYYYYNTKNYLYKTTPIPKYFNFEPSKMDRIIL